MYAASHVQHAALIIERYDGSQPFALWLKNYFRLHKKFGSRDRKTVAHLCYCYYRTGKAFAWLPATEKIITAVFLCSDTGSPLLQELRSEWNEKAGLPIHDKAKLLQAPDLAVDIFPWQDELSPEIEPEAFSLSFLKQPKVYLRIRPGRQPGVKSKLSSHQVPFEVINEECIAVESGLAVDRFLNLDEEVVVQDINSQQVFQAVQQEGFDDVWDCCAASGGKTILFHDRFRYTHLTVSDIRASILHNLQGRLRRAGIHNYEQFVADVGSPSFHLHKKFDFIICDAPCSGSGTWGRSPEQLQFFTADKIDYYAALQKKIVANAARCLKNGGYLLYITCSVFTKENEEAVGFVTGNLPLKLKSSAHFKGYNERADTLFAALFHKT